MMNIENFRNEIIETLFTNVHWYNNFDDANDDTYSEYTYSGLYLPTATAVANLRKLTHDFNSFAMHIKLHNFTELKIATQSLASPSDTYENTYYAININICPTQHSDVYDNNFFDIHINWNDNIMLCYHNQVSASLYDGRQTSYIIRLTDDGAYFVKTKASNELSKNFEDRRMIPLTVRKLQDVLPNPVCAVIMEYYSNGAYLYKDIIKDEFYLPIKVADLNKYHNKREYLEHIFKLELPKSVNKSKFQNAYRVCCAYKQTDKSVSISEMLQFQAPELGEITRFTAKAKKLIGSSFIEAFMTKRYKANHPVDMNTMDDMTWNRKRDPHIETLCDYIRFAELLGKPINIKAGTHTVSRLHDEYTDKLVKRMNRSKKLVIPETVLKYIELPSEFTRLETKSALMAEGTLQHNCVGTYVDKINNGDCVCYTADIAGEHLTIEVTYRGIHGLYVNQCLTKYNKRCNPETHEYVRNLIESQSDAALMRFVTENGVTPAVQDAYNHMMSLPSKKIPALTLEEFCENFDFDAPDIPF